MAYARIVSISFAFSLLITGIMGCSKDSNTSGDVHPPRVQPKPVPTWHGLSMTPGLPPKLAALSIGMPVTDLPKDWAAILQPGGLALSAKVQANITLNAQQTVRYLTLKSTLSAEALLKQWPNSVSARIDQRDTRHVWLLERERMQIHMAPQDNGFVLSYLPLTPLSHLIGPPSGTGMTFSSYIGKPFAALSSIIERTSTSQGGTGRLGWTHPLAFESLSLKVKIALAADGERVRSLTVFLRDGFDNALRQRIEAYALKHWQKDGSNSTRFSKNGVLMRMEQMPQLGLRKRTHKMLTLTFESLETPAHNGGSPAQTAD
ncbi:MAG: hypothetical protein ACPGQS_03640 [Bradymonadia bacterium]